MQTKLESWNIGRSACANQDCKGKNMIQFRTYKKKLRYHNLCLQNFYHLKINSTCSLDCDILSPGMQVQYPQPSEIRSFTITNSRFHFDTSI